MNISKPTTDKRAMWNGNRFDKLFEKGIAVGQSDIRTDSMFFVYKDEKFTFPSSRCVNLARWNGYFWEAPVKKLRRIRDG